MTVDYNISIVSVLVIITCNFRFSLHYQKKMRKKKFDDPCINLGKLTHSKCDYLEQKLQ